MGKNLSQSGKQPTAFMLATATPWKLLERYRETGKVNPKPHGGGAKSKLNQQQMAVVAQLVEQLAVLR